VSEAHVCPNMSARIYARRFGSANCIGGQAPALCHFLPLASVQRTVGVIVAPALIVGATRFRPLPAVSQVPTTVLCSASSSSSLSPKALNMKRGETRLGGRSSRALLNGELRACFTPWGGRIAGRVTEYIAEEVPRKCPRAARILGREYPVAGLGTPF
jgi:hypothetical protein